MLGGLLVGGVFFSPLGRSLTGMQERVQLRGAWRVCQDFVRDKLPSPASALFPAFEDADVFDLTGGQVRALGHVDSQNRYGAMIRSTFNCTVTPLGGTRWKLDSLTLNER
jgi:hypothetical protein